MSEFLMTAVVGVVCIVIGIMNMRGNISMLHSYHRNRVAEEDILPFGKRVGIGMIIVGISIIFFSALSAVTLKTGNQLFMIIGSVVMIIGMAVGFVIMFHAMKKYNKGIF